MSKFAIVGCEASGKTVFMSALSDFCRASLVPENAAANRFTRFAARQLRSLRQWPPATNPGKTVELDFTLRTNGEALASFGLLEFGGETFRAAFRDEDAQPAHRQAVKDLLGFLSDADFILVLVSLKELFRDPGEIPMEDFERDTESLWVTRGLLEFIREKVSAAGLAIGLTQADRYRDELATGGGAAAVFAARWPSIRAVAPDVPILPVASVSATDEEGRPAENFSTEGVLLALKEFARQTIGSPTDIIRELQPLKIELDVPQTSTTLATFARTIKSATAKLDALKRSCALSHEDHASEIALLADTLSRARDTLKMLKAQHPKPTKRKSAKKSAIRPTRVRRGYLVALLLASLVLLANEYAKPLFNPLFSGPTRGLSPIAGVTESMSAPTNTVPAPAEIPTSETNDLEVAAVIPPEEPPFRVWHDHNGKSIEAAWIETAPDGKSITLKTKKGRLIRAVLYKLSESDQDFVRQTRSGATTP